MPFKGYGLQTSQVYPLGVVCQYPTTKYLLSAYPYPLGVPLSGFRQGVTNVTFVSRGLFSGFQKISAVSKSYYLLPRMRERAHCHKAPKNPLGR
jgi:hypothetical protein